MGQYEYTISVGHPRATKDNQVYTHILEAEKKLGRFLKDGETVHHINEDKLNNNIENLLVFHSRGDHIRFHQIGKDVSRLKELEDGSFICEKKTCADCGAELKNVHATRCIACFNKRVKEGFYPGKSRAVNPNTNKVCTREELKAMIRTKTFVDIGKFFGVTDNAVRKWCVGLSLPRTKTQIKNMSDKEWEEL